MTLVVRGRCGLFRIKHGRSPPVKPSSPRFMRAHSWPAARPSLRSTHCAAEPLTPTLQTAPQSRSQSQDAATSGKHFQNKRGGEEVFKPFI